MRKLKPAGEELDDKRSSKASGVIRKLVRVHIWLYMIVNPTVQYFSL